MVIDPANTAIRTASRAAAPRTNSIRTIRLDYNVTTFGSSDLPIAISSSERATPPLSDAEHAGGGAAQNSRPGLARFAHRILPPPGLSRGLSGVRDARRFRRDPSSPRRPRFRLGADAAAHRRLLHAAARRHPPGPARPVASGGGGVGREYYHHHLCDHTVSPGGARRQAELYVPHAGTNWSPSGAPPSLAPRRPPRTAAQAG